MTTVEFHKAGQNRYAHGGKGKQLEAGRWRLWEFRGFSAALADCVPHDLFQSMLVLNTSLAVAFLFLHKISVTHTVIVDRSCPGNYSRESCHILMYPK
jgi:hypothetical protein